MAAQGSWCSHTDNLHVQTRDWCQLQLSSEIQFFGPTFGSYTVLLTIQVHNVKYLLEKKESSETIFFYQELWFDKKAQIIKNNLLQ